MLTDPFRSKSRSTALPSLRSETDPGTVGFGYGDRESIGHVVPEQVCEKVSKVSKVTTCFVDRLC